MKGVTDSETIQGYINTSDSSAQQDYNGQFHRSFDELTNCPFNKANDNVSWICSIECF